MAPIGMRGITKRYADGTEAVKQVDMEIADGEFMVLVGPSGCGKSTLLSMVAGLEDVSEGELRIGDEVVNDKAPKDRNIAMVFQNYALYPHMTVRENMAFPLKLAKLPAAEIKRKVEEAAAILDLGDHLDRKPGNLSGGQRQRVAMGRAIVRDPRVFLLDEPLSNLDAKLRVQMRTEIARLQQRLGTTTVYVTHDQTEAMTLGHRVAVMRKGVLQQVDEPKNLYEHPVNLFVAGFIGSPAMNFLPGRVEGATVRLPIASFPVPEELVDTLEDGAEVVVGLRPEHFEDAALVGEDDRRFGPTFTTRIEVLESMGSDLFAYFDASGEQVAAGELASMTEELGTVETPHREGAQLVARLSPESRVQRCEQAELWFDARKLSFFDPSTGANLRPGPGRDAAEAGSDRGGGTGSAGEEVGEGTDGSGGSGDGPRSKVERPAGPGGARPAKSAG